jgi:hypothetical protein
MIAKFAVGMENRLAALNAILNKLRAAQYAIRLTLQHIRKISALWTEAVAVIVQGILHNFGSLLGTESATTVPRSQIAQMQQKPP